MFAALTGAGLSAAAGLNAYVPFLLVALIARFTDVITLPSSFDWIESPWAIGGATLLLLTEVYAAGEAPIAGAESKDLARAIRARRRIEPVVVNCAAQLREVLPDVLRDGDLLLLMGAGDIGAAAQQIAREGLSSPTSDVSA